VCTLSEVPELEAIIRLMENFIKNDDTQELPDHGVCPRCDSPATFEEDRRNEVYL
jgi:hypothetical protein